MNVIFNRLHCHWYITNVLLYTSFVLLYITNVLVYTQIAYNKAIQNYYTAQIKRKLQNQAHKENVLKNTMKQAAETTASYIQKKQTNWLKTWAKIKERRIKTKLSLTTTQTPSTHNRIQNIWQGSQNKHEKKKTFINNPRNEAELAARSNSSRSFCHIMKQLPVF